MTKRIITYVWTTQKRWILGIAAFLLILAMALVMYSSFTHADESPKLTPQEIQLEKLLEATDNLTKQVKTLTSKVNTMQTSYNELEADYEIAMKEIHRLEVENTELTQEYQTYKQTQEKAHATLIQNIFN